MAKIETVATLKTGKFTQGTGKMSSNVDKFKAKFRDGMGKIPGILKTIGASALIAAAAIGKVVLSSLRYGSELSDMAFQAGVSVEKFQQLENAMVKAGGKAADMHKTLAKLAAAKAAAIAGDPMMIEGMKKFGLEVEDLAKLDPGEIFGKVALSGQSKGFTSEQKDALKDMLGIKTMLKAMEPLSTFGTKDFGKGAILSGADAAALDEGSDDYDLFMKKVKVGAAWRTTWWMNFFKSKKTLQEEEVQRQKTIDSQKKQREMAIAFDLETIAASRVAKEKKEAEKAKKEAEKKAKKEKKAKDDELKKQEKINKRIADIKKKTTGPGVTSDALLKVGGVIGGGITTKPEAVRIAAKQLLVQEKIATFLLSIDRKTTSKKQGLSA